MTIRVTPHPADLEVAAGTAFAEIAPYLPAPGHRDAPADAPGGSVGRHRIDLAPDRCWSCGGVRLAPQWCRRCATAYDAAAIRPILLMTREPAPVVTVGGSGPAVPAPPDVQEIADAIGGRVVRVTEPPRV